ncbi:MAG: hypothetical protein PHO92_03490 [Candidatus Peribacteraceae bacterium]|nr:hypothetical protein [Candidatus Peribacteraceae bacterium]
MPLRSARRLPRQYNRPVSRRMRDLADRRRKTRKQLRQEKLRRTVRRVQRLYVDWQRFVVRWFLVGLLAALLFILGFLLFSPLVQVRAVHIKRTDPRLDIEKVQMALVPIFGRHTAFLSNFEVLSLLRDAVPDIDQVSIVKEYPSDVSITVTLDPLVAQMVIVSPDAPGDAAQATAGSGALYDFLTNEGMYVTAAEPQPDLPVIRLVDWGARPQPGNIVLIPAFLQRIRDTEQALLSQLGFVTLERIVFLRGQEYHLLVERAAESGVLRPVLWFDARSSVEEHLQRYRAFLRALGPDAAKEYIDLRLKDRVVYK